MDNIGTVQRLRRYPVKGMAGEDLSEGRFTFAGLVGDRIYAFVDNDNRTDFPWMTARLADEWVLYRPRFLSPPGIDETLPSTEQYAVEVTTPEDNNFAVTSGAFRQLLEQRYGRSLRLRFSERSMHDSRPVSIFGLATVAKLGEEAGVALDPVRFRANLYVEWNDPQAFYEDALLGKELRIGESVAVMPVKKDGRCKVITLDPQTAVAAPEIFNVVARKHGGCAGIYAAVLRGGVVRRGDPIYLA